MSTRDFLCVRCGCPVYERGAACRDCMDADNAIALAMSQRAKATHARLAAKSHRILRPRIPQETR